ncbi:MAG: hypothetical protein H6712_02125 [Myxococcales bacterium]|nr:hypothetical protein [Myxococcales bacterium]MCB9712624.1 hypothetical protein [Myxococcales bacterium]
MVTWLSVLGVAWLMAPSLAEAAAPRGLGGAWLPRAIAEGSKPGLHREPPAPAPDAVMMGTAGRSGPWVDAFTDERTSEHVPAPSERPPLLPALPPGMTPRHVDGGGPIPEGPVPWRLAFEQPGPAKPLALAPPALPAAEALPTFGVLGSFAPAPEGGIEASGSAEIEPVATAPVDADASIDAPQLLGRRGVPPFWFERDYDTHRTRAMALPPLFVHREPKPGHPDKYFHADLALTFGWYSKTNERRTWINPLALFYGYRSERKTVWGTVPLLMGYRRVGEQFNFGQFPLVWWWGTKFVKNVLVVPFHYQQRAPESFRAVSGIVAWYGNRNLHDADLTNDRRYLVVAPVFWRFQRGLKRFDFSPLYVGGANELAGLRHMTVLPLFHWQSREFGNRRELWTLPWIRRVDDARRRSAWAVPLALTFHTRSPERELLSVTPLLWRARNELRGSQLWLAGPFARYRDPRQINTVLAPVYWQLHDRGSGRTTSLLLPLALARRGPESLRIYTLLGGGGRTANGWSMTVPPLLTFAGRTDRGVRYQGVGGLLWHVRQPDLDGERGRDDWVMGPLGYLGRDVDGGRLGVVPALSFFKWGGTRRYQVLTPLLWHVHDTDPANPRRTIVAGPFYHHATGPAGQRQVDGGIAPFLFYGRGSRWSYGVVPWLLLADVEDVAAGRRTTVTPLFVRSKDPDQRTLGIAAVAWDVKRADERHSVLFPLYYRRRVGDHALTLTPLGGRLARGDDVTTVWGPYLRRRREGADTRGVLPLVFVDEREVDGGHARHVVAAPLYFRRRSPTDDLDMWSPLVWRTEVRGDKPRHNLAVAPFYFRQRQPGGVDVDAGLGFFYSRDPTRHTHTLVAGPAFHRLSRERIHAGVVPLYWWMDSTTKRRLIALPMTIHVEDKSKNSYTTLSIPLWFDRRQANGRRTWGAFPFVFGGRSLYAITRFSVAPPGYFDVFRLRRNIRFTGYVPLLFRYQKCGFRIEDEASCQYTLWGSAPLFLYGRDGQGRRTHGALVYYWDRRPEGIRLYTPVFGVTNEPGKTLGWYAGPVGRRTTNTWVRTHVFPLYFRRSHRLEDRSFTLAAPPLFISRVRKDQRFFEAGLLVWQFRQPHRVATAVVPPVFFHSHAYAERRLTWVLPLFLRDDHWAKDQTWTALGPVLYVQRRKGEDLDFVQFPLVWHIERGPTEFTFGAFAWWDVRTKKGKMLQLVPGAFTRWATPERDTKIIGPGLGWWTKGRGATEGDLHWRALFGLFGAGVEAGTRYIAILGRKIPRGAAVRVDPKGSSGAKGSTSRRERRRERRALRQAKRAAERGARQARR